MTAWIWDIVRPLVPRLRAAWQDAAMNCMQGLGCALAAGAVAVAAGCSSSSAGPASDAGVRSVVDSAASEGGEGTDGSTGSEGGSDAGSDVALGDGSTSSRVVVEQNVTAAGTIGNIAISLDPHYASGLGCARTTSGPCTLDDCTAVDAPDGGALLEESAGTITLSGGNLPAPLMIAYGAQGAYRPSISGSALFAAGAVFTVSAPGDAFPAFSGQSAPAPGPITITAPAATMGTFGPTYLFDPTAPLTWSWTGGTAGNSVIFTVVNADLIMTCSFDAAGGTGTIPQDVVAKFPTAASTISIFSESSATIAAGTDTVQFEVESSGPQVLIAAQ
jgi:hypothetical protein